VAWHRYRIGEKVQLLYGGTTRFSTAELYEIVRLLPETDGEFQYRIKSTEGSHERVAKESELRNGEPRPIAQFSRQVVGFAARGFLLTPKRNAPDPRRFSRGPGPTDREVGAVFAGPNPSGEPLGLRGFLAAVQCLASFPPTLAGG